MTTLQDSWYTLAILQKDPFDWTITTCKQQNPKIQRWNFHKVRGKIIKFCNIVKLHCNEMKVTNDCIVLNHSTEVSVMKS